LIETRSAVIVGADEASTRALGGLLSELDYRVTAARQPAAGLAAARAVRADLVLLDAGLCGDASGHEVAVRLAAADIPIVLVSGAPGADGSDGGDGGGRDVARLAGCLAEDDEATVLAVRSYLGSHGYHVRVVRDGVAAVDAAAARDVAMVVMDVQLPGLDGFEVMRRLRTHDCARAPIVALTAHAMPGDEERCLEAGASAYMTKPVRLRQLIDTIGHLLEERR
jgi:CheY-like chemotaxis protein